MSSRVFLFLILMNSNLLLAQTSSGEDSSEDAKASARPAIACARPEDSDSGEKEVPEPDPEGCQVGDSLSDYDETIPADPDFSDSKSVEAELISADTVKPAIFPIDHVHSRWTTARVPAATWSGRRKPVIPFLEIRRPGTWASIPDRP